ncbi:MAG: EamA family transporter, partial [Gammaproteobacteria bacterium]
MRLPLRLCLGLALLAFAANSLLARAALGGGHADPWSFSALRLLAGALLLAALLALGRAPRPWGGPPPRPAARPPGGLLGPGALLLYALAFAAAYTRLDAATGALVLFASVQAGMVLGGLALGRRPARAELAGLALASTGVAVLLLPGLHRPPAPAAALMALAGLAWAAYSLQVPGARQATAATARHFALAAPAA